MPRAPRRGCSAKQRRQQSPPPAPRVPARPQANEDRRRSRRREAPPSPRGRRCCRCLRRERARSRGLIRGCRRQRRVDQRTTAAVAGLHVVRDDNRDRGPALTLHVGASQAREGAPHPLQHDTPMRDGRVGVAFSSWDGWPPGSPCCRRRPRAPGLARDVHGMADHSGRIGKYQQTGPLVVVDRRSLRRRRQRTTRRPWPPRGSGHQYAGSFACGDGNPTTFPSTGVERRRSMTTTARRTGRRARRS